MQANTHDDDDHITASSVSELVTSVDQRVYLLQGPDFRKILGRSYENLRKFLRLMKILGKTYDNADFRKILRKT